MRVLQSFMPLVLLMAVLSCGCSQPALESEQSTDHDTYNGEDGAQDANVIGEAAKGDHDDHDAASDVVDGQATAAIVLCGGCGQIKGSKLCCAKDAVSCQKCSLTVGAPGCCKISKGTDAMLCAGCGQVKGSTQCCDKNAANCVKCGKIQGAPGCCLASSVEPPNPYHVVPD